MIIIEKNLILIICGGKILKLFKTDQDYSLIKLLTILCKDQKSKIRFFYSSGDIYIYTNINYDHASSWLISQSLIPKNTKIPSFPIAIYIS